MGLFGGSTTADAKIKVGYDGKAADRGLKGLRNNAKKTGGVFSSTGAKVALAGAALAALTITLVKAKQALDFTIQSVVKFEAASSRLKAILKPTKEEFEALEKQAQKLGATTVFTATQVMEAFTEMGKLGAKTNEILASGNEVLSLAALAQVDMATAATVVVQTLNQFQLAAEESGRVVDNIAKSFTSSALDIMKFSEAMKFIGPIAGVTGEEIEEVTGALAVLADNAIDSSLAGTSMRRMLLELANANSKASKLIASTGKEANTLSEKFKILNELQIDVTQAADLFTLRAATGALIVIKNADAVGQLADEFRNAKGTAKEMADTMLDNVEGASIRLKSAQEALALSIKDKMLPVMRWWKESLIDITLLLKDIFTEEEREISLEKLKEKTALTRKIADLQLKINIAKIKGEETVQIFEDRRATRMENAIRMLDRLKKKQDELLGNGKPGEKPPIVTPITPTGLTPEEIEASQKAAEKAAQELLDIEEGFEKEILRMKKEAHEEILAADRKLKKEQADIYKQAETDRASEIATIDQNYFNLRMENEDEFHKDKIIQLEFQKELYPQLQAEINALIEAENDRHRNYEEDKDKEAREKRIANAESSLNSIATINNALMGLVDARTQREIKNLEKLGLSEEEFEKRKEKLLEEGEEKRRAFARVQQGIAIGEAIVNTYKAATGTFGDTPGGIVTRGLAMAAAVVAGLAQVATIQAQHFAMGGLVGDRQRTRQPDNVNAMLGKGERVMDAPTTDKYFNELESMQAGTYGKKRGGASSTYNIYGVSNEQFLQLTIANERQNKTGMRL